MAIAEATWSRVVALLASADEVALACHVDPDGDAIGSMLALRLALEQLGVRTSASWGVTAADEPGPLAVPAQYTFLPGTDELTPPAEFPHRPALLVVFDCASPERLGTLRPVVDGAECVIVIDHHGSGEAFGHEQMVDPEAPATAVIVADLIDRLGAALDRDIATCLYVGLVTDTGRFAYASTTADTMRLGARLIECGIDHAGINRRVWETHSFGYLKVLARALERAALVPRARLVWTAINQADLSDLGITLAETEGLIDVLRSVETAACVLVLKELPDGSWKTTMRSKGGVDVGAIAETLGGGGHAFAAGFVSHRPCDETVAAVVSQLVGSEPAAALSGR